MRILNEWKARQHQQSLLQKLRTQNITRNPVSYQQAQTVGLLFDATDPQDRNTVRDYTDQLKNQGKEVTLFAYFRAPEHDPNLPFKHFTNKDLDWFQRPKDDAIRHFVQQPFDFLINLNPSQEPVLEYISALSKAHLRVGPYSDKLYCYDLMIDTAKKRNLDYFIKHVAYFLNRLKNSRA